MTLEPLRMSSVALLTTYRRDGRGVDTPVGIRIAGDRAFFTTRAKTWKVKRLANNPSVALAPSTRMGKPIGPTVRGRAKRLDRTAKKGFQARFWIFVFRVVYRDVPVTYEVTPEER